MATPAIFVAPPLVPNTWDCPIDPVNHKFTGRDDAYQRYIDHFETGAIADNGLVVGPHSPRVVTVSELEFPVQTDPQGVAFAEVNVQRAFALREGRPVPFQHLWGFSLGFDWRRIGTFASNYIVLARGLGTNRLTAPLQRWVFQAGNAPSARENVSEINLLPGSMVPPELLANVVALGQPVEAIIVMAYPTREDGSPNTEDKIDSFDLAMRGYI